jgi:hypothetical protein
MRGAHEAAVIRPLLVVLSGWLPSISPHLPIPISFLNFRFLPKVS